MLRECGGFAMGPFELTDLIGQDVNEAVTHSVWEAFFQDPKFTPSLAQRRLVESGLHGRKAGRGWFAYSEGATPAANRATAAPAPAPGSVVLHAALPGPAAVLRRAHRGGGHQGHRGGTPTGRRASSGCRTGPAWRRPTASGDEPGRRQVPLLRPGAGLPGRDPDRPGASAQASEADLGQAVGLFQALGKQVSVIEDVPGMIVARTVAMLIDLAVDAVAKAVARPRTSTPPCGWA